MRRLLTWAQVCVICGLCAACATTQGVALPDGTLMLGEVMRVLTPDMVRTGEVAPDEHWNGLPQILQARGWSATEVEQGRIVVVRYQIYWYNTASGLVRDALGLERIDEGLTVQRGNIVEIAIHDPHGSVIRRVRAASLADGACYYVDVPVGHGVELFGALNLVGARGSASLYCQGIESEGWQRPRTYWHKLPGAVPGGTVTGPSGFPKPHELPVEPASATPPGSDTSGLAMLIIFRRRAVNGAAIDMTVRVDGEKVAVLEDNRCDAVWLAPGNHVVTVDGHNLIGELPRRQLSLSVAAEDRIVAEYRVDDARINQLGLSLLYMPRDKWQDETFSFVQRPATPDDSCAIRHAPVIVRGAAPAPDPGDPRAPPR